MKGGRTPTPARSAAARANGAKGGRPRKPRDDAEYAVVGAPPSDPLERIDWTHRLLSLALFRAATDPELDERSRRQEIRAMAGVLVRLTPLERVWLAEDKIRDDQEKKARPAGPEMNEVDDGGAEGAAAPLSGAPPRAR